MTVFPLGIRRMPGQSPDSLQGGLGSERLGEASGRPGAPVRPDRNLALELVRVTESAAMGAGRWVGRGDKIAADQAAVDAMRAMLDSVSMDGMVVIRGGGEDEAPVAY